MKSTGIIAIIAVVLSMMLCVHWAEANGNCRFNLEQKWKQVQHEQERQKAEWRDIDREASGMERDGGGAQGVIRSVPSGDRRWQYP